MTFTTAPDLMDPASSSANPACMKKTMNAAESVQAKFTAAFGSPARVSAPAGVPPPPM